jgi:hypothetical protein
MSSCGSFGSWTSSPSYLSLECVSIHCCDLVDNLLHPGFQVNKSFRSIASAKQLWLSVVRDLSSRLLMDPPGDEILETLSTTEILEEIQRIVVGPRTWFSTNLSPPKIHRKIQVPLEKLDLSQSVDVTFHSDGRHILFYGARGAYFKGMECWEIHSGRCLWGWTSPGFTFRDATVDLRQGGSEAVVSLIETRCVVPPSHVPSRFIFFSPGTRNNASSFRKSVCRPASHASCCALPSM